MAMVAMMNLAFRLSPIRSWNDKPAEIHVKNWDRIPLVYDKPGKMENTLCLVADNILLRIFFIST